MSLDSPQSDLKIQKRLVQKEEFFIKCSECGKEIIGDSEERTIYQMRLHWRNSKHEGEPKF